MSTCWGKAAVAAAIVIAGCGTALAQGQQAAPAGAASVAPGSAAAEAGAPVARVNGETITRGEFERNLAFVLRRKNALAGGEDAAGVEGGPAAAATVTDELRSQVLDQLIDEELLYLEARKRGLLAAAESVDAEIAQARAQFPTPEAFAAALGENQLTEAGLRTVVSRNLSLQNLVEKGVEPGVAVSDAEVAEFYAANAASFAIPEQAHARHILVQVGEGDDEAAKQAKRAKAAGLLAQLKAGASFEDLARGNSDCASAPAGGDLGFFDRGQMVPEFETAAFALKPGEISAIVETEYGYHIILLEELKPAGMISQAEAAPQITEYLRARKTKAAVEALIKGLRAAATIEKLP